MEEKSPYFSPKRTRNFVKHQREAGSSKNLKTTLLQKTVRNATQEQITVAPQIKVELIPLENRRRQRKQIKIETSPEKVFKVEPEQPTSQQAITDSKQVQWEPKDWRQMLENIRRMRQTTSAPVDTMGCDQFKNDEQLPAESRRFHTLVSLMLSSQTKDQVNFECIQRLRKHGLTPENIVATDSDVLEKLIYPVSFYKNKTKFIKQTAQIMLTEHNGDIPATLEGLLKLPGVGKKMAHLCMRSAWNVITGIGVDTHVHRISNWLRWVPKETNTPEETRVALESWLPFELWEEVNQLLVGFGQTTCTSSYPRCNECLNADICPAKGKHGIRKSPVKREQGDLEF
ncbi:endonuclease III-like protein 1 [Topomyia yanbarensis]|uniref:endonuclease III-like protein 1 n=1 Tax=Topomyia yanbarensis TaxID=2498891 RepID=UPI00273C5EF7|nr:endonuclease III-like protein 1 [Topomyia yanbarensis]